MSSKLFVGGLSFSTTQEEVESLFAQAGPIQSVFLATDRDTGRSRGFAFVEYANDGDATQAIEQFNGFELGGRALRVNAAEEKPARRSFGGPPSGGGGGRPGGGGGGGGKGGFGSISRPKGSRRNIRGKKRSL